MDTKFEVSVSNGKVVGAYDMNEIIRNVESDSDKRKLVDLWTAYYAIKAELTTLKRLVDALPRDNSLPY
jgi:hypothetical protein